MQLKGIKFKSGNMKLKVFIKIIIFGTHSHKVTGLVDRGEAVDVIYLNFSKAFDVVST